MKIITRGMPLGECLQGILADLNVRGVTVELMNKETFILSDEVSMGTDFIMGKRDADHKVRIIPFSAIASLRLD